MPRIKQLKEGFYTLYRSYIQHPSAESAAALQRMCQMSDENLKTEIQNLNDKMPDQAQHTVNKRNRSSKVKPTRN